MAWHEPVMTREVLSFLRPENGGVFVDCTVGMGGHSRALLDAGATSVIGLDRDPAALVIAAEALGVTSKNVEEMKAKSQSAEVRRLLGVEGKFGDMMGISNDWAYNIVKQVGNYGDIYERNVGQGSALRFARGINALWSRGGQMYPLPLR